MISADYLEEETESIQNSKPAERIREQEEQTGNRRELNLPVLSCDVETGRCGVFTNYDRLQIKIGKWQREYINFTIFIQE